MPIFQSNTGRIAVSVDGVLIDNVSWDYMDGGDVAPAMQKYNPGGMAPMVALGGLRDRSDVTVRRVWSTATFALYKALDNVAGTASMTVSYTPLSPDRKTTAGAPIVYTGVLSNVTRPTYDSSSSAMVYLELQMSCNE